MFFDWDDGNTGHIALHNVTPEEAEQVIQNNPLELEEGERNGEDRITHLGETDLGRVLFVAVTIRKEKARVVTAYPVKKKTRDFYAQHKAKTNEKLTSYT